MNDILENWPEHGYGEYDPQYFYEDDTDSQNDNRPVHPDAWANNKDLEGGF